MFIKGIGGRRSLSDITHPRRTGVLSTTLLVHLGREPKDLTEGVNKEEIKYSSRKS